MSCCSDRRMVVGSSLRVRGGDLGKRWPDPYTVGTDRSGGWPERGGSER